MREGVSGKLGMAEKKGADLLSLDLRLTAPADLCALSMEAACQFGYAMGADAGLARTEQHNFSPVQTRMYSIAHAIAHARKLKKPDDEADTLAAAQLSALFGTLASDEHIKP